MNSERSIDSIGHEYAVQLSELVADLRSWASDCDENVLYRTPPDGEWTVMENLVHVVEFLPYWVEELYGVIKSPEEPFGRTHEDPDRIKSVEDHALDSLQDVLVNLDDAADQACRRLSAIPDDQWNSAGVHRRGRMTLTEITEYFLISHLADHIEQAKAAARAVEASRNEISDRHGH